LLARCWGAVPVNEQCWL